MDCIFCDLIAGRIPASMVYEGEHVLAFMSLEQPNPYKVLVIPRAHVENLYDLSDEQAAYIFQASVKIACVIRDVSGCDGLNLVQSNGRAGQQDVFHFHIHLIPRFVGDYEQGRITLTWDNATLDRAELDRLAARLRGGMGRAMGAS